VATLPGTAGPYVALLAEIVIAAGLMIAVLWISNTTRIMRLTGVVAGMLVASYITLEAPLSGMSMNPARSFASALPSGLWHDLWIYFVAPPLGMFLGAALYVRLRANAVIECAKLDHAPSQRCIHCGYVPPSFARALRGI
jgi:aquaporin Z